jgi:ABC-type iron transport system FetAB permease component
MTEVAAQPLVCPFPHGAAAVARSRADMVVRRVLRVRERPAGASARSAVSAFRRSMVISTIRCTLTYLVFPFVLPALGLVTETGVVLGMVIGVLAITCDVFTIRRFFSVDHKWRWHFSAVAFTVICMLTVLLAQDVVHMVT